MVGTPVQLVTRCCAIRRSAASGSKRRIMTVGLPSWIAPHTCDGPAPWCRGNVSSDTPPGWPRRVEATSERYSLMRASIWAPGCTTETTPLGRPVVPEV
jgi:hypothetical protein